jgi:RNA polymerase sigma-B factor
VAFLALVKAVDRFDPQHGVAFTSFAGRTIEGELKRHFRDKTWAVRVPRSAKELHLRVRRANDELSKTMGRSPSAREVAAHLDVAVDEVVEALSTAMAYSASSLDAPSPSETDGRARSEALPDRSNPIEAADDQLEIERLMVGLPAREQEIVRLRFFDDLTQDEIAERVGVSQMHVSRLLRRSLSAMRSAASTAVRPD